jgi:hypothetical protein
MDLIAIISLKLIPKKKKIISSLKNEAEFLKILVKIVKIIKK